MRQENLHRHTAEGPSTSVLISLMFLGLLSRFTELDLVIPGILKKGEDRTDPSGD